MQSWKKKKKNGETNRFRKAVNERDRPTAHGESSPTRCFQGRAYFSSVENSPLTWAVQGQPITTHKLQRQVPATSWVGPVPCVQYPVTAWNESLKTRIKKTTNDTVALWEEGKSKARSKFRFCRYYISPVVRQRYVKSSNVYIQWLWSHPPSCSCARNPSADNRFRKKYGVWQLLVSSINFFHVSP